MLQLDYGQGPVHTHIECPECLSVLQVPLDVFPDTPVPCDCCGSEAGRKGILLRCSCCGTVFLGPIEE